MLIHTWNVHPNIQVNKLNANHLHAQHSTNALYIKYMHLGTKSYKGTRVKILEENAKKFSYNHKSLQNFSWKQTLKAYKSNMGINTPNT